MSNLPVTPYDGPYDRDKVTGRWDNDVAHVAYSEDVAALVKDVDDLIGDVQVRKAELRHVSHVATREACRFTLEAAEHLLTSVREMLQIEADG